MSFARSALFLATLTVLAACASPVDETFSRSTRTPSQSAVTVAPLPARTTSPQTSQPVTLVPATPAPHGTDQAGGYPAAPRPGYQPSVAAPSYPPQNVNTVPAGNRVMGSLETMAQPGAPTPSQAPISTVPQQGGQTPGTMGSLGTIGAVTPAPSQPTTLVSIAPPADMSSMQGEVLVDAITVGLENNGVSIANFGDPSASILVRPRLAAIPTGPQTIIAYTAEVVSSSGQTLHQISGQDVVAASSPDGWGAVDDAALARIGASMAASLGAYLSRL